MSLLADALRGELAGSDGAGFDEAPTNGSPDAHESEILRALEALGAIDLDDEASLQRLLDDDALRAHVTDVAAAELDAPDVKLPAAMRAAASAAFDTPAVVPIRAARTRSVSTEPLRAAAFRPIPYIRTWMTAAAMLLVALGAVVFLSATDHDAEAGLQLNALARVDLASSVRMSSIEPGYFARLGHVFTPGEDELLSFAFGRDALLVVGGGDAVRVTRSDLLESVVASLDGVAVDAVLRLESGEARLATREGPILLELGSAGMLVLQEGAAHAAFHAPGSDLPAVALAEGSIARFHRANGTSVPLTGPSRVLLAPEGPQQYGTPARTLFRDLEFFGGPLPRATQVRTVSSRLWTIAKGPARRGRNDIRIEAASSETASVRLTWRAPEILVDATTLRVALRAPKGTTVSVPGLGEAQVNGGHDDDPNATGASEPGVATVEIALPKGWYHRLEARTVTLEITLPEAGPAGTRAWFDGVSLVLGTTNEMAIARLGGRVPPAADAPVAGNG